ncbi:GYF domain-containing protein [Microcoleus sp.]|uniref:DUF4339 domain-containing protein n=1 Tax=Microcoleus sp. TaxID=44472 RepID=UPI003524578A
MNTWPKWLPYPLSWIRAFGLTYIFTALVWSRFPFQHSDSVVAVLIGAWATVPFLFTFFHWVISSVAKFLLTHLPAYPKLNPVRQYLTDRWSGSERSHWREGLNAFIVSFVAFTISLFVVSYLTPVPSKVDADYARGFYLLRKNLLRLRVELIPIGMFLVSAYLYQYDLWARHRRAVKSVAKTKTPGPGQKKKRSPTGNLPAPDPVEQELNKLKAESGMNQMKTVRREVSSVLDIPEWYVFRSGKSEGPYTKLQLLEIQEITARTKVRRGLTDWRRAAEIPELETYLTEK